MVDAKTHAARPRRRRDHVRARDHGDDLRGRPHLRRALQPGGHVRVRAHPPLPVAARRRLLGRAARRRGRRRRAPARARSATSRTSARRCPSGSQGQSFLWELVLTLLPDVRDHGRRHRHARGRRGGRDRDRRHGRPRRDVRRPDLRRLDEPGALARARRSSPATCTRSGSTSSRPVLGAVARRARLPARPRRASRAQTNGMQRERALRLRRTTPAAR